MIVAVGNLNVDLIAYTDRMPGPDEGVEVEEWGFYPGGSAANFAVTVKRLDYPSAIVCAIGDGIWSRWLLDVLEEEGVENRCVKVEGEQSIVFVAMTKDNKYMFSLKGASHKLRPEHLTKELVRGDVVHVASKGYDIASRVLEVAEGLKSYSPGPYSFIEGDKIRGIIDKFDFVFVNEPEARALKILEKRPRILVITKGAKGSEIITEEERIEVPAFRVKVVDTTGAGDVYAAAFLVYYLRTRDLKRAAYFASAAAAVKVTKRGAQARVTLEEVRRLLASQGLDWV